LTPGADDSYKSQTASIVSVNGSKGTTYVYAGDRWNSSHLGDSRYVWLPLQLDGAARTASMDWYDQWRIDTARGRWMLS
jgi:hypothetical protein